MKDSSKRASTPKEENIEGVEDKCSAPHTPHTLHHYNKEDRREPINIRIRRAIHDQFMKYCALTDMTAGQFYEQAGILFMDLNPPPEPNLLIISKPKQKNTSIRDKVKSSILVKKLKPIVAAFRNLKQRGVEPPIALIENLDVMFKKYDKISHPTDELNTLIEEAIEYV